MEKFMEDYYKLVEKAEKAVKSLRGKLRFRHVDEYVDRLSSVYTCYMLVLLTMGYVLAGFLIRFKSIACWVPKHITGGQTKYINSYCWVHNTYYVPMNQSLPRPEEDRPHVIPYYQWVPFILLAQGILFYIPSIVWHNLNQQGGVDCDDIIEAAHKLTHQILPEKSVPDKQDEYRDKLLKLIDNQMQRFITSRSRKRETGVRCSISNVVNLMCLPCKYRYGNYMVMLFLFTKLLYLFNILGQLFIMNVVLATKYHIYGFEVLDYLLSDADWTRSPGVVFPRVTFCDLDVRRLGNIHRYTVQCTLPHNMYIEKIYMFLWFWLVLLAIVTALSMLVWAMRAMSLSDRVKFVDNHLLDVSVTNAEVEQFVADYLGQDGVFILRLIAHNTNTITVTEIMCTLYLSFTAQRNIPDFIKKEI